MPQDRDETPLLITFSPKTNCNQKNLLKLIAYYIDNVFIYLFEGTKDFQLYPELNTNGNIHWHGYVIPDKCWYKVLLRMKSYGFVKVNKVKQSLSRAMEYCSKDKYKMLNVLPKRYVPMTMSTLRKLNRRNIVEYFKDYDDRLCHFAFTDLDFIPVHDALELVEELDEGVAPPVELIEDDSEEDE